MTTHEIQGARRERDKVGQQKLILVGLKHTHTQNKLGLSSIFVAAIG